MMDFDLMNKELIKHHEGYSCRIYKDSLGYMTGGYGHLIKIGDEFSQQEWNRLFDGDYQIAVGDYEDMKFRLDPVRQAVVIDMLFNLGSAKFAKFERTMQAIRAGQYQEAAAHMLDSKWASQVGRRAKRLAKMMETGAWTD